MAGSGVAGGEVPRSFDEETYNKYLLDDRGPKKVIDYSQIEVDADLTSFDMDLQAPTEKAVEGQYRMKHTNEKFSIGGGRPGADAATTSKDAQEPIPVALTEE